MAFEANLMCKTSTNATEGLVTVSWAYGPSTDNAATITASAYFDEWVDQISKNDTITIVASDETEIREFTNVSGTAPVTVAAFINAGDIPAGSITEAKLVANSMTGTIAANVADANVIGGFTQLFRINTAGGASANTDVIVTHKIRVIDVWVVNNGAGTASDTIEVLNGSSGISDVIDISGADTTVARVGALDDANVEIAASGTLRITEVDGGGSDSPATTVYVLAVRVA